jgi:hypothetical protein
MEANKEFATVQKVAYTLNVVIFLGSLSVVLLIGICICAFFYPGSPQLGSGLLYSFDGKLQLASITTNSVMATTGDSAQPRGIRIGAGGLITGDDHGKLMVLAKGQAHQVLYSDGARIMWVDATKLPIATIENVGSTAIIPLSMHHLPGQFLTAKKDENLRSLNMKREELLTTALNGELVVVEPPMTQNQRLLCMEAQSYALQPEMAQLYACSSKKAVIQAIQMSNQFVPLVFSIGGTRLPRDISRPAALAPRTDPNYPLFIGISGLYRLTAAIQTINRTELVCIFARARGSPVLGEFARRSDRTPIPCDLVSGELITHLTAGDMVGIQISSNGAATFEVKTAQSRISIELIAPGLAIVS